MLASYDLREMLHCIKTSPSLSKMIHEQPKIWLSIIQIRYPDLSPEEIAVVKENPKLAPLFLHRIEYYPYEKMNTVLLGYLPEDVAKTLPGDSPQQTYLRINAWLKAHPDAECITKLASALSLIPAAEAKLKSLINKN